LTSLHFLDAPETEEEKEKAGKDKEKSRKNVTSPESAPTSQKSTATTTGLLPEVEDEEEWLSGLQSYISQGEREVSRFKLLTSVCQPLVGVLL
jgi:hypothetical protein